MPEINNVYQSWLESHVSGYIRLETDEKNFIDPKSDKVIFVDLKINRYFNEIT